MRAFKILKDRRGSEYIEAAVSCVILVFILSTAVSAVSCAQAKSEAAYICRACLDAALFSGTAEAGDEKFLELCGENGFDAGISWDADWLDPAERTVQLGDELRCTVESVYYLADFAGVKVPVKISVTKSGLSGRYFR